MIVNDLQPAIATARSSRLSRRAPSVAAVATDLAVLSAVTVAAAVGRMRLPFFREVADVNDLAQLVGVPIVIGWILFIAAHGGYPRTRWEPGRRSTSRSSEERWWRPA